MVFGGDSVGAGGSFDHALLDGNDGFTINGKVSFDRFGQSVAAAGDTNGYCAE